MILLDYSQVAISNLHQHIKHTQLEPNLLRHMILNSIRRVNREFQRQYGQLVICSDNRHYWRKNYFQYYKANRKRDRDESGIDWQMVFEILHELRDEIKKNFPYKVLNVYQAEADDIIGVVAKEHHDKEKILILSGDKDFQQLQVYPGVRQYNMIKDVYMDCPDPVKFLKEHIMRGDKGDGVPNFLSQDDVFVIGKRQTPITSAKVDLWMTQEPEEFCDEVMLRNFRRNERLVDLKCVPADLQTSILEAFEKPVIGTRAMIYPYLISRRMKMLLEVARDF